MYAARVRTGVALIDGAWHVVQNINGEMSVYDPPFATEAEAEAKAGEVAKAFRQTAADHGATVL